MRQGECQMRQMRQARLSQMRQGECYSRCPAIRHAGERTTLLGPKTRQGVMPGYSQPSRPRSNRQTQPRSNHRPRVTMAGPQLTDWNRPMELRKLGPIYDRGRGATVGVGTWPGTTELVVTTDEIEAATVLTTVVFAASLDTASVAKGTISSGLADNGAGG